MRSVAAVSGNPWSEYIGTPTSQVWGVAQRRGGFCVHGCEFQGKLIVVSSRMALRKVPYYRVARFKWLKLQVEVDGVLF